MRTGKISVLQKRVREKHAPIIFIVLLSTAVVFYSCASGIEVMKDIELSQPVVAIFLSIGKKNRPAKMENECTIGAQLDVLRSEALLRGNLSKSLKKQAVYVSEDVEKADLTIAVQTIDYKANCWQGWMRKVYVRQWNLRMMS